MSQSRGMLGSIKMWRFAIGLLLLLLSLSACAPLVDADQPQRAEDATVHIAAGMPVGQTFVPHHGGLNGIELWLIPGSATEGEIVFRLAQEPGDAAVIRTSRLPLAGITAPGYVRFDFEPVPDSQNQYYYGSCDLQGTQGSIEVGAGPGGAYLNGAAYLQHRPSDTQLTFNLAYAPGYVAWDLVLAGLEWALWLLLTFVAFVLPGLVLLRAVIKGRSLSAGAWLGLGVGVSLALYPLLLLWTDWAGVHLGAFYAWLPMLVCFVAFAAGRPWRGLRLDQMWRSWRSSDSLYPDFALLVLVVLVFGVRFVVIRTLDAPMWGDSQQHATIVQLILDHDGLFRSWEPYTPYETFSVHFGFHSITAVFAWLTGMGAVRGTLVAGQIVNGLAILTLYPLAERLWKGNRWAGIGAVLVGGLLSPMPGYYVNWGRFPQLLGQAILPAALWLVLELVERDKLSWVLAGIAGFVVAGMSLSYYRMPFYFVTFLAVWLFGQVLKARRDLAWWRSLVVCGIVAGVLAAMCLAPWGLRIAGGSQLPEKLEAGVTLSYTLASVLEDYRLWRDIRTYLPPLLLGLVAASVIVDLVTRKGVSLLLVGWIALLASLVAGRLVNLPGSNMIQNFAILIALYIPTSLLVGGGVVGTVSSALAKAKLGFRWLGWAALLAASLYGARLQAGILDTAHLMVTRPDVLAMDWISRHTEADAVFLVEGFSIYGGRSAVGADAGWWLPLLGERQNTMPPQYALMNEDAMTTAYPDDVVELVNVLESEPLTSPSSVEAMCDLSVTHVYLGQRHGLVGAGVVQLYSPDELSQNPALQLIHEQDRVRVYALDPAACTP